ALTVGVPPVSLISSLPGSTGFGFFLIMIVGLTGSFGSGKSTVAEMLKDLGNACVIDADAIARNLQHKGEPGYNAIVENFGPEALDANGEPDRLKIAAWVFTDKLMLDKLNNLIHPLVWDEEVRLLREHGNENLRVLMVPLLYETGADRLCDKVIVVAVDNATREQRLKMRDN